MPVLNDSGFNQRPRPPAPRSSRSAGLLSNVFSKVGSAVSHAVHSATTPHSAPSSYPGPYSPKYLHQQANVGKPAWEVGLGKVIPAPAARTAKPSLQGLVNEIRQIRASNISTGVGDIHPGANQHSGGGFLGMGAIHIPSLNLLDLSGAYHTLGTLAKNTGADVLNLPGNTLRSAEQLGGAAFDDLLHGHLGNQNFLPTPGNGSESANLLKDAWSASVLGHIARGDIGGAVKTFTAHPLYGAQEFAGLYGLAGRGLGMVARSGAIGEKAATLASTARAPRELAPGVAGDAQHYSKNVLTKAAQAGMEKLPKAQRAVYNVTGRSAARMLKRRTDELVATSGARAQHAIADVTTRLKEAKPKGAAAGVVPHAVMGTAGSPEQFVTGLQDMLQGLKQHEATGKLKGPALRANHEHQANIESFLAHPDVQGAFQSAGDYVTNQHAIDKRLGDLGLLDYGQMERRAMEPYALTQMKDHGVTMAGDNPLPTPQYVAAKQDYADYKTAIKQLQQAKLDHVTLTSSAGDAAKVVRDAERKLAQAQQAEQRTYGILLGRHGGNAPLPPEVAARMNSYLDRTNAAQQTLAEAKSHLAQTIAERKALGKEGIAAAKDNVKDALANAQISKPFRGAKGKLKKQMAVDNGDGTFRPLATSEIASHMVDNGVSPTAYVRMTAPTEGLRNYLSNWKASRGGSRAARYTGQGLESGTWTPGYAALAKSQVGSVSKLQKALSHDAFVKAAAIKDESGQPIYFDKTNWRDAADAYAQRTGMQVEPMPAHPAQVSPYLKDRINASQSSSDVAQAADEAAQAGKNNVVLVPKPMLDRYLAHEKVSQSSSGNLSYVNRKFRNTVLPLSPKWVAGNAVEAGLRGALVGASPRSYRLASKVIDEMRAQGFGEQADHLERMATGGLHYGMNERMNREQLGLEGNQAPNVAVGALARAPVLRHLGAVYSAYTERVFKWNRQMESAGEKAVLGRHMQRQLQEFAGTWAKATTAQSQYMDKLAKGYADPQLAADAGRYVHETLGQYDRFSPAMRRFTRSIAPFSPWYLNAAKFVYYTLPARHPVTQAVLSDVARTHQKDWASQHDVPHDAAAGFPTGDLLTALKTGTDQYVNVGRYTPFGAFTGGPLNYATQMVLPQFSGAIHNVFGQDWSGRDLKGPDGTKVTDQAQLGLQALNSLLEDFGGPLNAAERVFLQHGDTPYNTSRIWNTQLKPDTHHGGPGILGGANRVFNPAYPTYLKGNAAGGGTGGPGFSVVQPQGAGSAATGPGFKVTLPGGK